MSSDIEQIKAVRIQTLDRLAEVRQAPKPTYWLEGQRVLWEEYAESLQRTVDWCDQKLSESMPYEVRSEARPV